MSRLIDAEDVKALINGLDSLPFEEEVDEIVDRIPTAFDVDKVLEKLEEKSIIFETCFTVNEHRWILTKEAIEIVKVGGLDD